MKKNIPHLITFSRLILAPTFLALLLSANSSPKYDEFAIGSLWLCYFLIEISDLLDGYLARKLHSVTEFGKIFDPFADSLSRLTAFLGFLLIGQMPVWIFVVIFYRDLIISFLRMILAGQGLVQGARLTGKIKAWVYALTNIVALLTFSAKRALILMPFFDILNILNLVFFISAAGIAVISGLDYLSFFIKRQPKTS